MADGTLNLKAISPFDPEVAKLMADLDRYQAPLYPDESNHLESAETISGPNYRLMGAYLDGVLVGIGAAKIMTTASGGYGELKRFYVPDAHRGKGIAERIILSLEEWLVANQISCSRLETGIYQEAAIRFYKKLGYREIKPFGDYKEDPLSLFMEKSLATD